MPFVLISKPDHRICGRFDTRKGADDEMERLSRLASKRGETFDASITWEPPMPRDEQEAGEFEADARLY